MKKRKWLPFLIVLLMAFALLLIKNAQREDDVKDVNRNRGFDRRASFIEYTKHAKCRMDCRQISDEEVKEIMESGKINYRKSDLKDKPCPSYALEGITSDNQRVRIVFGQCDTKTKVITVIDLDTDWTCECPGDESKFKNRN